MANESEHILLKNNVHKSLLVDGFAIPQNAHSILKKCGSYPSRAQAQKAKIYIDGILYDAIIVNVNFGGKYADRSDVIQIRYAHKSELSLTLRRIFNISYDYIYNVRNRESYKNRTHIKLEPSAREYFILKALEIPNTFKMECHPLQSDYCMPSINEDLNITEDQKQEHNMTDNKIVISLKHGNDPKFSNEGQKIQKITSSISALTAIELLKVVDNTINPREAKAGPITKAIYKTLSESPSLFWLKSKGILLATTKCTVLNELGSKVELSFSDPQYEGIMDGGHNFLAIANFITLKFFGDQQKNWKDCKKYWNENYEKILAKAREEEDRDNSILKFSIPVEIIAPVSEDEGAIDDYYKAIAEICSARNNNVQLKDSAKGNQEGFYDYLKTVLADLPIIWKTNEEGKIKSEDVISWATLPLYFLQEGEHLIKSPKLSKVNIYSSKNKCVQNFGEIVSCESYSEEQNGKTIINSPLIKSALDMSIDILKYFDRIVVNFPELFKTTAHSKLATSAGDIIKKEKEMSGLFYTTDDKATCEYPLAYIYPLVAGLTSLMRYNKDTDTITWAFNPAEINLSYLNLSDYVASMKLIRYDPQKIGKGVLFYSLGADAYRQICSTLG